MSGFIPHQHCNQYESFKIKPSQFYGTVGSTIVIVPEFGQGNLVHACPISGNCKIQLHSGDVIDTHGSLITMHSQHKMPTLEELMQEMMMKKQQEQAMCGGGCPTANNNSGLKRGRSNDSETEILYANSQRGPMNFGR